MAERTLFHTPSYWISSKKAKRALDVAMSFFALTVFSPLIPFIALVIVIDSRGPILFRATRIGKFGRPFTLYKLRTMCANAEQRLPQLQHLNKAAPFMIRIPDDPRITRVGRWLRRFGVDEVPQFLNVLSGDMSVVGPRPQAPHEVALYDEIQRRRLEVVPGITGLWQVTSRNKPCFEEWVRRDLEYIDNWSLLLDLKIIFLTLPAIFLRAHH